MQAVLVSFIIIRTARTRAIPYIPIYRTIPRTGLSHDLNGLFETIKHNRTRLVFRGMTLHKLAAGAIDNVTV